MMRLFLFCLSLLLGANAFAASTKSTILGTVTDATGAVIANAEVTVRSETTNFSSKVTTNSEGDFVAADLDPDIYTVTVRSAGFKQFVRSGVVLVVDKRLRVDASLSVGEISEKVEVAGQAPLVDSDSSSIGQVIHRDEVNRLPLNGRYFLQLALLVPGSNTGYPGNRQMGNELG